MQYTDMQILDYMKEQKGLDINLIFYYIDALPNYKTAILPRHIKFVKSLIANYGDVSAVAKEFEYSVDGMNNMFKKIQTCMHLQYEEFKKEGKLLPMFQSFKNYIPVNPNRKFKPVMILEERAVQKEKSDQVVKLEGLISDNPQWYFMVKDPIQRNLVKYLLNGHTPEEIERKLGISRDVIYRKVFKRNSESVFDILLKK